MVSHTSEVVAGPSRSRRKYMTGRDRSRTIELGTLSEVDEDLYQNKKDVLDLPPPPSTMSQDDLCIGTIRRPTNGTVRSLARHLSEKRKNEVAERLEARQAKHKELKEAQETDEQVERMKALQERTELRERIEGIDHHPMKTRQYAQFSSEMRIQRSVSERRDLRNPLAKWSPNCSDDRPSLSEFQVRTPIPISRQGSQLIHPLSRTPSAIAPQPVLVYDPRTMSLIDTRFPPPPPKDYGVPIWYPMPHHPPPPMYIPLGPPVMPQHPQKLYKRIKEPSVCSQICCGGIAQLMWTIIIIILLGVVSALLLALFYI